jgi:hypothetical protein
MSKKSFLMPTVMAVAGLLGAANAVASVPNPSSLDHHLISSAQQLASSPLSNLKVENSTSSTQLAQNHYSHSSHASHASHSSHYSSRY